MSCFSRSGKPLSSIISPLNRNKANFNEYTPSIGWYMLQGHACSSFDYEIVVERLNLFQSEYGEQLWQHKGKVSVECVKRINSMAPENAAPFYSRPLTVRCETALVYPLVFLLPCPSPPPSPRKSTTPLEMLEQPLKQTERIRNYCRRMQNSISIKIAPHPHSSAVVSSCPQSPKQTMRYTTTKMNVNFTRPNLMFMLCMCVLCHYGRRESFTPFLFLTLSLSVSLCRFRSRCAQCHCRHVFIRCFLFSKLNVLFIDSYPF